LSSNTNLRNRIQAILLDYQYNLKPFFSVQFQWCHRKCDFSLTENSATWNISYHYELVEREKIASLAEEKFTVTHVQRWNPASNGVMRATIRTPETVRT